MFDKIVGGVKKVFKKVLGFVGKIFNSKIGKILMIAASVVTAGAALYGAYAGMTSALGTVTQQMSMMAKFGHVAGGFLKGAVQGAKLASQALGQVATGEFGAAANTLKSVGDIGQAANVAGAANVAAQAAPTELAQAPSSVAAAPGEAVGSNLISAPGAAPGLPAGPQVGVASPAAQLNAQGWNSTVANYGPGFDPSALQPGVTASGVTPPNIDTSLTSLATRTPPGESGGFLTRLGKSLGEAATSPGGMVVAGQALSGYAQGEALQEQESDRQRRLRNSAWDKGDEVRPWEHVWGYDANAPVAESRSPRTRARRGLLRRQQVA